MEHGIRRWPSSKQHLKLRKRKKEPKGEAEEKVPGQAERKLEA